MLNLASTSDLLKVTTGSAGTIEVHATWVDLLTTTGAVTPGRTNTADISSAATTTVVTTVTASTNGADGGAGGDGGGGGGGGGVGMNPGLGGDD